MQRLNRVFGNPTPLDQMMYIPQVADLVNNLANGNVTACSPFPGMGEDPYTDEQIESHNAFLSSLKAVVAR